MKVFISWSGARSKAVAEALSDWLPRVIHEIEPYFSVDTKLGGVWYRQLIQELRDAELGIFCLTPENMHADWILFEAGALTMTLAKDQNQTRIFPYLYGFRAQDKLEGPFQEIQYTQATRQGTRKLLEDVNSIMGNRLSPQVFDDTFRVWWPELEQKLKEIGDQDNIDRVQNLALKSLNKIREMKKDSSELTENIYFQQVINHSIEEMVGRLDEITPGSPGYSVPFGLYPYYLVNLLKTLKPIVRAIAIVDQDEYFWQQPIANEILRNTGENSTRVFVFESDEHMRENLRILERHAPQYNVRVLWKNNLVAHYPEFQEDFSIIGHTGVRSRLLAKYDDSDMMRVIKFTTDDHEISYHDEVLTDIIDLAIPISNTFNFKDDLEVEDLIKRVFKISTGLRQWNELRTVEMSRYIPIFDYHEHEEEHAYFREMMNTMLDICKQHHKTRSGRITALEMGSGTGIFTKRLAALGRIDITGLEIDWACYKALENNIRKIHANYVIENTPKDLENEDSTTIYFPELDTRIKIIAQDSRIYNPTGRFQYIFSSFADHHIRSEDKAQYFNNMRRNLEPGGLIIVGDEFLPEYANDESFPAIARQEALHKYHGHIISIAEQQGYKELVNLEQAALESGLQGHGDFKLSCAEYEQLAEEANFKVEKIKIGPLNKDDIGGVYVYILRLDE